MRKTRRKFESSFKAKVVIEALKERETLQQLTLKFELHPNQISVWKQEFLQNSSLIFEEKVQKEIPDTNVSELYAKIGKLEKWLQRYHNRGHQGIELKKPAEKYKLAA